MYWFIHDDSPELTGFAAGSAGIAYFLVTLYQQTKKRAYLDTAIEAARRIQTHVMPQGDGCLINSPPAANTETASDGRDLYFHRVGFHNGVVGIWRLFFQLARATGNSEWTEWVHRLARGGMSRFPKPGDGVYGVNYIPVPYENAYIAQGYLDLHVAYGNPEYLAFSEHVCSEILKDSVVDETGRYWKHYYRGTYQSYTSVKGGTLAMVMPLLHLDGLYQRRRPLMVLPDSPFKPALYPAQWPKP